MTTHAAPAPVADSGRLAVTISRVVRRGSVLQVTVDAPRGSAVTLYRNGRKVASGTKSVFSVRVGRLTNHRFVAVASSGQTRVSSASTLIRTSGSQLR